MKTITDRLHEMAEELRRLEREADRLGERELCVFIGAAGLFAVDLLRERHPRKIH